jgi:hypothetical protein
VETSDLYVNADTTTNFVASYKPCIMFRVLRLHQVLKCFGSNDNLPPHPVRLRISAWYMGRTDCPSEFRLEATLLDDVAGRLAHKILRHVETTTLESPSNHWERASLEMEIPTDWLLSRSGRPKLLLCVTVYGKDRMNRKGNYGCKVADISVRILGSPAQVTTAVC